MRRGRAGHFAGEHIGAIAFHAQAERGLHQSGDLHVAQVHLLQTRARIGHQRAQHLQLAVVNQIAAAAAHHFGTRARIAI